MKAIFGLLLGLLALGQFTPSQDFDPKKSPPPPDYSDPAYWAALPGKVDPSDLRVPGSNQQAQGIGGGVDVFYIHPTGYYERSHWNSPLDKKLQGGGGGLTGTRPTVMFMLASQASALNASGSIYAPHYREAALGAYLDRIANPKSENGLKAIEFAYVDVAKAFDHFIKHFNKGRPFIIASHSQGSTHALRLLAEKIDGTKLRSRLIAAYVIGYRVPLDVFERLYENIKPCESPDDLGCVVAWDTIGEGGAVRSSLFHWYPSGWENVVGKPTLCVNPLSWSRDGELSPASAHKGRVDVKSMGSPKEGLSEPLPSATWAQCRDGVLYVAEQKGYFSMGGGKNYHLYDYSLFYMDIQANALLRTQAYLASAKNP